MTVSSSEHASISAWAPSVRLSLAIAVLTFSGYVVFNYYRLGDDLYTWSKSFASYDWRQYLGLSKRWLVQYGHLSFLFVLFVLSKYIFVTDRVNKNLLHFTKLAIPHTVPIFIIHFPLLFLIGALTGHDPQNAWHEVLLLVSVIAVGVLFGRLCLISKPFFDRAGKSIGAYLEKLGGEAGRGPATPVNFKITVAHSEFLKIARIVATFSIVFGHFSFPHFSTFDIPGFDHWRRWAVPFFFMTSGYFAIMLIERSPGGVLPAIFRRYWNLWYAVIPMLLIVPIIDHIGFRLDPELYFYNDVFVTESEGGPADLPTFFLTVINSLLFLNEIFIYNLLDFGTTFGGVRTFNNDSYWFLCYLMPFSALLAVMLKVKGPRKYVWLAILAVFFGPPILMLAPLFFAGCLAYLIHKHV